MINSVKLNGYPCCEEHGAMTKVSKRGMWRCLTCHVGFDEERAYLKDSEAGFVSASHETNAMEAKQ